VSGASGEPCEEVASRAYSLNPCVTTALLLSCATKDTLHLYNYQNDPRIKLLLWDLGDSTFADELQKRDPRSEELTLFLIKKFELENNQDKAFETALHHIENGGTSSRVKEVLLSKLEENPYLAKKLLAEHRCILNNIK